MRQFDVSRQQTATGPTAATGPAALPLLGFWALCCAMSQPEPVATGPVSLTPAGAAPVVVVLVLVALKRGVRSMHGRADTQRRSLLNVSPATRGLLALLFGTAAVLAHGVYPMLGLTALALVVMLGLERGEVPTFPSGPPQDGVPLDFGARGLGARLNATTSRGFCLCGVLCAAGAAWLALRPDSEPLRPDRELWVEALLIATPLWLSGTRPPTSGAGRAPISCAAAARRAPDRAA